MPNEKGGSPRLVPRPLGAHTVIPMNLEFHYYATTALALRAGYSADDAHRIGRSAEHVDQALDAYLIEDSEAGTGEDARTEQTQNYVFWDEKVFRDIYLPFHFIPGDEAKARKERVDGESNPWIVTPDSPIAREILIAALRSGNPYRIGIALHAYADTWAHQNFTGRTERINEVKPGSPLPAAGHLQALTSPDQATELWEDPRLFKPEVDNRDRFLAAARMIYRYLRTALRRDFEDEVLVVGELAEMWERRDLDDRAREYDFTIRYDIEPWNPQFWLIEAGISTNLDSPVRQRGYNKLKWLGGELARRSGQAESLRRVWTDGRFDNSSLKAWSQAAREHRKEALGLIDARLGKSDVRIVG